MSSEATEAGLAIGTASTRTRVSFFFVAHVVLIVVVLAGFSPSFYLRAAFHHTTQLPLLLYVHGVVLTVWFSLPIVQAWLIRTKRLRLHRRLGYIAAGYAVVKKGARDNFSSR